MNSQVHSSLFGIQLWEKAAVMVWWSAGHLLGLWWGSLLTLTGWAGLNIHLLEACLEARFLRNRSLWVQSDLLPRKCVLELQFKEAEQFSVWLSLSVWLGWKPQAEDGEEILAGEEVGKTQVAGQQHHLPFEICVLIWILNRVVRSVELWCLMLSGNPPPSQNLVFQFLNLVGRVNSCLPHLWRSDVTDVLPSVCSRPSYTITTHCPAFRNRVQAETEKTMFKDRLMCRPYIFLQMGPST